MKKVQQIEELVVKLDGIRTGIFAYIPDENDSSVIKETIKFGERKTWLFRNYDIMMSALINNHHQLNPLRYAFKYSATEYMLFTDFEYIDGKYVSYLANKRVVIIPEESRRISRVNYIQIDNAKSAKQADFLIQKQTFGLFRKAAKLIPDLYVGTVEVVPFDNSGMFTIKMNNSTVQIHACSTAKLASINKARKQEGKPVIPFIKDVPKYTSLCVFSDKDLYEQIEFDSVADIVLKDIVELLNTNFEGVSAQIIPCEFKKKIIM